METKSEWKELLHRVDDFVYYLFRFVWASLVLTVTVNTLGEPRGWPRMEFFQALAILAAAEYFGFKIPEGGVRRYIFWSVVGIILIQFYL